MKDKECKLPIFITKCEAPIVSCKHNYMNFSEMLISLLTFLKLTPRAVADTERRGAAGLQIKHNTCYAFSNRVLGGGGQISVETGGGVSDAYNIIQK